MINTEDKKQSVHYWFRVLGHRLCLSNTEVIMNTTKSLLLQLKTQFEREDKKHKLLGVIWLSPQQRYEILKEIMLPVAKKA
jgi:hypothetical protein